jgi:hypothetical protein
MTAWVLKLCVEAEPESVLYLKDAVVESYRGERKLG